MPPLDDETANSSAALSRLRLLVEQLSASGTERLPTERDLALSMHVGRRAIRRAMEVLEAEGTVWRRQGKGTFLKPPEDSTLPFPTTTLAGRASPVDVMETRLLIEPRLARLAALRATGEDIAALRRLAARTEAADDDDGWELWDSALHRLIAHAAGNRTLAAMHDLLLSVREEAPWRALRARARTVERRRSAHHMHGRIVDAIATRDPGAAERAMFDHLTVLDENLRGEATGRSLADGEPSEPAAAVRARARDTETIEP